MTASTQAKETGYAPANGLQMYYEIHREKGDGVPLLLIHGAFMMAGTWGPLLPALAASRQVIVPEMQAHGHTGDIDRPMTYELMADDTAALLRHLGVERADVAGYSLGGGVAWQLAFRHPALVRKLIPISISTSTAAGAMAPEYHPALASLTPEMFDAVPWKATYQEINPDPNGFAKLVEKIKETAKEPYTWADDLIKGVEAPTLIIVGDAEGVFISQIAREFELRGGGVFGDLYGLPASRLAVLPGTTHVGMLERVDWLTSMITEFLDAPMPVAA